MDRVLSEPELEEKIRELGFEGEVAVGPGPVVLCRPGRAWDDFFWKCIRLAQNSSSFLTVEWNGIRVEVTQHDTAADAVYRRWRWARERKEEREKEEREKRRISEAVGMGEGEFTFWVAVFLDYLLDQEGEMPFSSIVKKERECHSFSPERAPAPTLKFLRERVKERFAKEDAYRRDFDPEWNVFDERDQALAFAWLWQDPAEQLRVLGPILEAVKIMTQDAMVEMAMGVNGAGEELQKLTEKAWSGASALWYREERQEVLVYLVRAEGPAEPKSVVGVDFEDIPALFGGEYQENCLYWEARSSARGHALVRLAGENTTVNQQITDMLGIQGEARGDFVMIPWWLDERREG